MITNKLILILFPLQMLYFESATFYIKTYIRIPQLSYDYFQTSKINKKTQDQIEKKIIVSDKYNKNLNEFIRKQFSLNSLEQNKSSIRHQEIKSLLRHMKTSGYFYSVSIKSKIYDRKQIIKIDCQSMSNLKSVNIKDNKSLIIPEKKILNLFKEQINKPQNFRLINGALKKIYEWYYEKGYQWVDIKVVKGQKESIEIKITEGIVNSIQFKFSSPIGELVQRKNTYLLNHIRDFLGIKEKSRLNYYTIETKLNELKQKRIFENCDYTVSRSTKQPEQLNLLISIYELPDKTTFLIGQNTHFSPGIIETIESKIFNSINKHFKKIIYRVENPETKKQKYLNDRGAQNFITKNNYNSQKIINNLLTQTNISSPGNLYEWYTNPTHFISSNNLGISYNTQNIGKQKEYLKISFQFPSVYKNLVLTYCKPWVTLYNRRHSLIQIKFMQQSFYSNHKKITESLNQIFNHKFIFLESLSTMKTLKTKLKTQLNNNWGLKKAFRVESIEQKQTGIKKRNEIFFNKTIKDLKQLKMNEYSFVYSNSQLINSTHANFVSIDAKLKYKFYYNNDINWSKTGSNFMILSKYVIPLYKIPVYTLDNHYKKFAQRTILKYTYYKNYDYSKSGKIFSNYLAFWDLEVGKLLGASTFFPWVEKFELKFPNYIIENKSNIPNFPQLLSRVRCEHHLGTPQNHSVFLFLDYVYSDKRHLFYKNKDIVNTVSQIIHNKNNKYRLSGGIGYQIKTSIHHLPPIRVEFSINSQNEKTIYFRIIEVLSSIAIHKKV